MIRPLRGVNVSRERSRPILSNTAGGGIETARSPLGRITKPLFDEELDDQGWLIVPACMSGAKKRSPC